MFIMKSLLLGTLDAVQAIFGVGTMPDPALHPLCSLFLPSASPWFLAEPPRFLSCPLGLSPMTNSF